MLDNTYNMDSTMSHQFGAGTPVYDVNGDKIGAVSEEGVQGDNLVLQKGLIFPHDYYVPLRTIVGSNADGIHLNVTKDDVTNQTFNNAPAGGALDDAPLYSDMATGDAGTPDASRYETAQRSGDVRVPVREEQLNVGKQQTEVGRAHVHKDIVEQQQVSDVPVMHEELRVERVPVQGGPVDLGPDAFTERDIDVPLRGEQVVANKETRIAEEVHLHKQQVTENQRVGDTVRKERVRIEGDGIDQAQDDVPLDSDTLAYDQNADDIESRRGI